MTRNPVAREEDVFCPGELEILEEDRQADDEAFEGNDCVGWGGSGQGYLKHYTYQSPRKGGGTGGTSPPIHKSVETSIGKGRRSKIPSASTQSFHAL